MTEHALKLAVIILAAGSASRFGSPKQLEKFQDKTLLSITLNVAKQISENVVLVVGAYADEIKSEFGPFDNNTLVDPKVVYNPDWQTGMASSIKVAINSLETDFGGAMILLADQPLVTESHLRALVENWYDESLNRSWAVATQYPSSLGVPALFDRKAFSDLGNLKGDQGARTLLNTKSEYIKRVQPDFSPIDIDTPDQLALLNT